MQIVFVRLLDVPHITLVACTAPVVLSTVFPAVEDGLVLALVIRAAHGEGVLGPDDEGGPLAPCGAKRCLQGIEFG